MNSDLAETYCDLGVLLERTDHFAEAEACYRHALSLGLHYAESHNNLGLLLAETGRHGEAEACFRRVLELTPDYLPARHNLSLILLKLGRYEEGCSLHESRNLDSPEWGTGRMLRRRARAAVSALAG
jgi:protein O-GlcNAc transferase